MRPFDLVRASLLIGFSALLSACPKKEEVAPEPAPAATPLQPTGASDKAGAEPPAVAAPAATPSAVAPATAAAAAKPKKKDDQGGW